MLVPRPPIFLAGFVFVCHAETDTPESTHVATYTVGQESLDVPTEVSPGLSIDLTATIENTGDVEWGTKTTYLHYIGDKEAGGVDLHLTAATAPGETGTLTGTMTAPTTNGNYELVWQPVVEGYEIGTRITREFTVSDGGGDDSGTKTDDSGTKTDDSGKGGDSGK
jgi:hypothetical protein